MKGSAFEESPLPDPPGDRPGCGSYTVFHVNPEPESPGRKGTAQLLPTYIEGSRAGGRPVQACFNLLSSKHQI